MPCEITTYFEAFHPNILGDRTGVQMASGQIIAAAWKQLRQFSPDVIVDVGCGNGVAVAACAAELKPEKVVLVESRLRMDPWGGGDVAEGLVKSLGFETELMSPERMASRQCDLLMSGLAWCDHEPPPLLLRFARDSLRDRGLMILMVKRSLVKQVPGFENFFVIQELSGGDVVAAIYKRSNQK